MIRLTCGHCGHQDELDCFCRTPIGGELPKGQYQCPACNIAWRRVQSDYRMIQAGKERLFIPGKIQLVPCDGSL